VDYKELAARVLEGGSDEELLAWCHARGKTPSQEELEVWNDFMPKRGWKDSGIGMEYGPEGVSAYTRLQSVHRQGEV
jgi:hypothetical protein